MSLRFIAPVMENDVKIARCLKTEADAKAIRWKNTLIGNFIGRIPSFNYVKEMTVKLWNLKGEVETVLLESGIFVFRFTCEEDKQKILEHGPWTVARRPLLLRAWSPDANMERINMKTIPVWVSLPGLPFQYWSGENLSVIGSVLGRPLYTDRYTKSKERLSCAIM